MKTFKNFLEQTLDSQQRAQLVKERQKAQTTAHQELMLQRQKDREAAEEQREEELAAQQKEREENLAAQREASEQQRLEQQQKQLQQRLNQLEAGK